MHNKEKGLSVGLLIALVGFPQISETIYTPALPNVAKGLMTSAYMVEATLAIYFLGFALGVLSLGGISDYLGRRPVMLGGLLIYGTATLGCANVDSVEVLLAWRFLQAFGASVGSVITQTMLRDCYDGAARTKLFSILSGALSFSPAIGPLLGGFVSEFLGWRANFWTLTILAIVLYFWAFFSLKETRPAHVKKLSMKGFRGLIIAMISSRQLCGHIILIGGANGVIFGFYQEAPFVFIEQLGMEPTTYGCFGLLIAAATIFSARLSYRNSGLISTKEFIQWGVICVMGGGLIFTSTVFTGILSSGLGLTIAVLSLFLIFFGIGLIIPNTLSHALKAYQHAAGTAGSVFGGSYYFLIAALTWGLSAFHNGGELPLPLYITCLGILMIMAAQMIRQNNLTEEKVNT